MVQAIRCRRTNMNSSIINGSKVSSLPVAIQVEIMLYAIMLYYTSPKDELEKSIDAHKKWLADNIKKGNVIFRPAGRWHGWVCFSLRVRIFGYGRYSF